MGYWKKERASMKRALIGKDFFSEKFPKSFYQIQIWRIRWQEN